MGFFSSKKKEKEVVNEDELRDKQEAIKAADEKQVELAFRFMGQADVQKASDPMIRQFLRKKGLTHVQIDQAFARRDQKKNETPEAQKPKEQTPPPQQQQQAQISLPGEDAVAKVDDEPMEVKLERAFKTGFLSLKNAKLNEFDEKIFQIVPLKTLILSGNPIKSIPDSIENLVNLRIIQLSECNLTDETLNIKLFNLPNLVELNLSKNKISHVTQIGNLLQLQRCDLSNNDIVELPEEISNCKQLQLLNLAHNHISFFPHSFTQLQNLKRITIVGNNFEAEITQALQNGGVQSLFKCLSG